MCFTIYETSTSDDYGGIDKHKTKCQLNIRDEWEEVLKVRDEEKNV